MTTILSVAEKPSVAKELARIIAGDQNFNTKQGHSVYNKIFEINRCRFSNQDGCKMSITSVSGHLMNLDFGETHKGWRSCDPVALFDAPLVESVGDGGNNGKQIEKTLAEQAKRHNTLLLWLDCDLEGEAICFEVMKVCLKANPRMAVFRARFSALIHRDINRAMTFPERPNEKMNDAVNARKEIDLRIGAAFTRFQTLHLQNRFGMDGVFSYGPCQFPTLGFIIERHMKIEKFSEEEFWSIQCDYEGPDPDNPSGQGRLVCPFSWDRHRLYDKAACALLYESCFQEDGLVTAAVYKNDARPTSQHRPTPLNTVELQKRAARWLHLGSEVTLKVAEELYHRGILSYPRTETDSFSDMYNLVEMISPHRNHSVWGRYAEQLQDAGKFEWPANGGHDDKAHPPIHPTACVELASLNNDDERKVYELVTRHFLACCSKDARGDRTVIGVRISDGLDPEAGERFSATGLMVTERNYLDVYRYDSWNAKKVPTLRLGDKFEPKNFLMTRGHTAPPIHLREEDLITTMDKEGIGTDATISNHIKTVQDRNYAEKRDGKFIPTPIGMALYDAYNDMGYALTRPNLRAAMEADCQRIARGELPKQEMVKACLDTMKKCFQDCVKNTNKMDSAIMKYNLGHGGAGAAAGEEREIYVTERASFLTCGKCRRGMDLQSRALPNGSTKKILMCLHCKESHSLPTSDKAVLEAFAHECPICRYQVLQVTYPQKNPWHMCPQCYNRPPGPPDAIELPDGQAVVDFKCFNCAHPGCPLARRVVGAEIDIAPCSDKNCTDGSYRIKNTSKGQILACSLNKQDGSGCNVRPWFLPKVIKVATPLPVMCPKCSRKGSTVHMLSVTLDREHVPPGTCMQRELCPCCDSFWRELSYAPLPSKAELHPQIYEQQANPPVLIAYDQNTRSENRGFNFQPHQPSAPVTSNYGAAATGIGFQKQTSYGASAPNYGGSNAEIAAPPCRCNPTTPSVQRTVYKEGPNKGRFFFTCAKGRSEDGACGFFSWADELVSGGSTGGGYGGGYGGGGAGTGGSSMSATDSTAPMCRCNIPSSRRQVKKQGENCGKMFFGCSKRQDDATNCGFFAWDNDAGMTAGGSAGAAETGRARNEEGVTCSHCKVSGHWARQCNTPCQNPSCSKPFCRR